MWYVLSIYQTKRMFYKVQCRDGETTACGMDMIHNIASHELWPHFFFHFIRQHRVMCWMHGCQKFLKSPLDLQYFVVFLYTASLCFLFSCSLFPFAESEKWNHKNASISARLNVGGVSRRWATLLLKYKLLCKKRM